MKDENSISKYLKINMNNRESSIDILKITGCFCVIILHYTNYYYKPTLNMGEYLFLNSIRWFVFGCIGFYIIATGYLNCNKKIDKKYYMRLIPTIITFLSFSLITHLISTSYEGDQSFLSYLYGGIKWYFWKYNAYFWYMNFYLSFYLLIPFINIIINNINKWQHILLIAISICIISLPDCLAVASDFWPILKESGITLPSYFSKDCFPFIYYFIGAFFKKYPVCINSLKKNMYLVFLLLVLVLHSYLDTVYLNIYQEQFELGQHIYTFNSYGNIFTIITCTIYFVCISNIRIRNKMVNSIVIFISSYTLEMYLGLAIADKLVNKLCELNKYEIDCSIMGFSIWFFGELFILLGGGIIAATWKILYIRIKHLLSSKH